MILKRNEETDLKDWTYKGRECKIVGTAEREVREHASAAETGSCVSSQESADLAGDDCI
jgi:hypothetical protein